MNRYLQVSIETSNPDESDMLVARLSQAGFEGFEEELRTLHAFIPESLFEADHLGKIIAEIKGFADPFHTMFRTAVIEPKNWNEAWEKDFEPVIVDEFCAVRAHFHAPVSSVKHDLIITPKMSFGTGHHATTFMMIRAMEELTFSTRAVLDFGTGTGILAILACSLGARSVLAIDSDDWSIENAAENVAVNGCTAVEIRKADKLTGIGPFDIILANINLRVILDTMEIIRQHLVPEGVFIGSGVLESDEDRIRAVVIKAGLTFQRLMVKDNWMSFRLNI